VALAVLLNSPTVVALVVLYIDSLLVAVASVISANHGGANNINPTVKLAVAGTVVPDILRQHGGASRILDSPINMVALLVLETLRQT
jgi:hypothetical protein